MTDLPASGMRQCILDTAAGLFVARGYDGVSIREIAEECQLSKAGLYYHFKDKEALFLAVLDDSLAGYEKLLTEVVSASGDTRAALTDFIRSVFTQMSANHRSIFRLAMQDLGKVNPEAQIAFNQRYQENFLNPLADLFKAGISSGQFRPNDPHLYVWSLLGIMYPFFNPAFSNQPDKVDGVLNLITTVFFEGVETRK